MKNKTFARICCVSVAAVGAAALVGALLLHYLRLDYRVDVSYGEHTQHDITVAIPRRTIGGETHAVLYIHGGGWSGGDNTENVKKVARENGCVAAAMDYRMFGDGADCEDMLSDITAAITFLKDYAAEKDVTIKSLSLSGHSAGGHLATLYAYKHHDISPIPISFVVGEAPPVDFTDPEFYQGEYGDSFLQIAGLLIGGGTQITRENMAEKQAELLSVSPINYVSADSPRTILVFGAKDELVPISNSGRISAVLDAAGVPYDLFEMPNSGHSIDGDKEIQRDYFKKLKQLIKENIAFLQ